MKDDMAGGAAVAGAMCALARLDAPHPVIGVIPTTENMPGGTAMRPGDVVRGASGKTVEIINTDAEGRLILGDALWYAQQLGATHLVDVATLTGACLVALGRSVSGLFGTDAAWVNYVDTTAADAGDRVWPMPIYEEAREQLRSEIADMINSAGTSRAAPSRRRRSCASLPATARGPTSTSRARPGPNRRSPISRRARPAWPCACSPRLG